MRVVITDADYPSVDLERSILEAAGFEVILAQCRLPMDVVQAAQGAVALLVQYAPITRAVLEALPTVRVVSRYGVGVDTVDLDAARELGVWVANVPDYGVEEVATHALAMALALVRHLPFLDRSVRGGQWHYLATGPIRRPSTLTMGIVGMGRIGRLVAERARPVFREVLAYDPYIPDDAWPASVKRTETLAALFAQSNVISLHMPLTPESRGLVNWQLLKQMPAGSYLVNTARGALVVIDDLLRALDEGILAGAALDVLPEEPPIPDHPVLSHPRVLLTPHTAFYSAEAETELRRKAALNIVSWLQNGRPLYPVVTGA